MLLGHKSRCFDVRISPDGGKAISASEDGTSRIWDIKSRSTLATLLHDPSSEVLRAIFLSRQGDASGTSAANTSMVVTCGANGKAIVWTKSSDESAYVNALVLNHTCEQIYACEEMPACDNKQLLTAADETIYIWDIQHSPSRASQTMSFQSLRDSDTAFGGPRNRRARRRQLCRDRQG